MKRIHYPYHIPQSAAKFESTERFLEHVSLVQTNAKKVDYSGVVLTKINANEKTMATTQEEYHTFVIGETGCGKTRRIILPTIRLMAKSHRSMIITDPKGEIYKKTANALKAHGYQINVLNFRDPSRSDRWNPLGVIEKLYRSESILDQDMAIQLLEDMATTLSKRVEDKGDPFWHNEAIKVFIGTALLIIKYGPIGSLSFENISIVNKAMSPFPASQYQSIIDKLPKNSPIVANLFGYMNMHKEGKQSVTGVFEGLIGPYVNKSALMDLFLQSEINVENIGNAPSAIFLIIPDDSSVMYPMATIFVNQLYSLLVRIADSNQNGLLRNRVSFILDEFANFAQIPDIDSKLTAARSRGITFVLVCQSMEQLELKYPQGASEILMANCRVWIYMSCRNVKFLERLEKLSGQYVSSYTNERYPLISASDLQHFDMGQVLLFNDRCYPSFGYLPDYSEYDFGEDISEAALAEPHEVSEHSPIDIEHLFARVRTDITRAALDGSVMSTASKPSSVFSPFSSGLIERFGQHSQPDEDEDDKPASGNKKPGIDIDAMIARIDARIAELEAGESETDAPDEGATPSKNTHPEAGSAPERQSLHGKIHLPLDEDDEDDDDGDDDDEPLNQSLLNKLRNLKPTVPTSNDDE